MNMVLVGEEQICIIKLRGQLTDIPKPGNINNRRVGSLNIDTLAPISTLNINSN